MYTSVLSFPYHQYLQPDGLTTIGLSTFISMVCGLTNGTNAVCGMLVSSGETTTYRKGGAKP